MLKLNTNHIQGLIPPTQDCNILRPMDTLPAFMRMKTTYYMATVHRLFLRKGSVGT
jgi:hypothetical protein